MRYEVSETHVVVVESTSPDKAIALVGVLKSGSDPDRHPRLGRIVSEARCTETSAREIF